MQHRSERVLIETERYRIYGVLTLPRDGYRSRMSDFLNSGEREFISLTHVVMEAICSGTPVLATRIPGNVGMLGSDYAGYVEPGDAEGLAALIERCRDQPAILDELCRQCAARAPLFEPERERATLLSLLNDLLEKPR